MQQHLLEHIKAIPLFDKSTPDLLGRLAQKSREIEMHKGQLLFVKGEAAESFYLVTRGWVKLFRETIEGTQAIVDILPQGHVFGETSIFEDDAYPYSAEATEPSCVIAMPLSLLKQEIDANVQFARSMLSAMARYRRQQEQEFEHLTLQNAQQRIGCFLLRLARQSEQGPTEIKLPYDKTLVASRLGMQPETFSRALTKLKQTTGIEVKGSTIYMDDIAQLANYSCNICSSEFPCKDIGGKIVSKS